MTVKMIKVWIDWRFKNGLNVDTRLNITIDINLTIE